MSSRNQLCTADEEWGAMSSADVHRSGVVGSRARLAAAIRSMELTFTVPGPSGWWHSIGNNR